MTRLCEPGASATNQTTKTPVLHETIDILIWIYLILRFELNDTKYLPFQGSTFSHFLVQIISCDNLKRPSYSLNKNNCS